MADFYFSLVDLAPVEMLTLLAEFVQQADGSPTYLADAFLSVSITSRIVIVDLHLVDSKSRFGRKKEKQRNMNALLDLYQKQNNKEARRDKELPEEALPFVEGLPKILIASASGDSHSDPDPHTVLYIAKGLSAQRVGEIADDLQRYGIACQIAATATDYYLFANGDPTRRSALCAAEAGAFFADLQRLEAHKITTQQHQFDIFCPSDFAVGKRALEAFCRFARLAHPLWEQATHDIADGPLIAIDREVDGVPKILYLGHLTWLPALDLAPDEMMLESAEIVSLTDSLEAMQKLRVAIQQIDERIGYRLELRRTRYRAPSEVQRQQLELRRIEIDNQLAYIESFLKPRPRLLRFTQKQLPALADLLRSLDVRLLRNGSLRYGFQASRPRRTEIAQGAEFFPEGVHYLLIGSEVSQLQLSRLSWWAQTDDQPMSFWLDPFWARYYHRYENNSLIFTPYKTLLHPLMHSWSETDFDQEMVRFVAQQQAASMDVYIRELISDEFTGDRGSFGVPEKPIYVFSGETGPEAMLSLWVLNEAEFVPLIVKLGWINDNLALLDPEEVIDFIGDMADKTKQANLSTRLTMRAESAEQTLAATSRTVGRTFHQFLESIPTTLTETFDKLISEATQLTEEARAINERLETMRKLHAEMKGMVAEVERHIEETDRYANERLEQHNNTWIQRVETSIAHAENTRAQLETQLESAVHEIENARSRIRSRLERLNG